MSTNRTIATVQNPIPGSILDIARQRDQFFAPFEQMFNSVFDGFLTEIPKKDRTVQGFPKLDIYENHGKWVVEASMAGADPKDVNVEIFPQDGQRVLAISGKMEGEYQHREGARYYVKELTRKHFRRLLTLPEHVQGDPEAFFHNGMLTLTWAVEQTLSPQPRRITIKTPDQVSQTDADKPPEACKDGNHELWDDGKYTGVCKNCNWDSV